MFRRFRPWRSGRLRIVLLAILAVLAAPPLLILVFRFVPPLVTPLMMIRFAEGYGLQRHWVAYDRIAPVLAESVIASEDNLFCEETWGFDIKAMQSQLDAWQDGERPRGASTITMQIAKNLLLWPGRDPVRKVIEAWLTPQIALLWPKQRVLEVYLNIVEFGPGIYGAEAASRRFFRKPASALSAREAAYLAAVLPRPLVWSVAPPSPVVRQRAVVIEQRIPQIRPLFACVR
jgi:monofunctional biosynthetic peptidoglycan transglycosylase